MSAAQANAAVESLSHGCASRLQHLEVIPEVNVYASFVLPYGSEDVGPTDDRSREGIGTVLLRKYVFWVRVRNALYTQEEAAEMRMHGAQTVEEGFGPARERARFASQRNIAVRIIADIEADGGLVRGGNIPHPVRYQRLQAKKSLFRDHLCR